MRHAIPNPRDSSYVHITRYSYHNSMKHWTGYSRNYSISERTAVWVLLDQVVSESTAEYRWTLVHRGNIGFANHEGIEVFQISAALTQNISEMSMVFSSRCWFVVQFLSGRSQSFKVVEDRKECSRLLVDLFLIFNGSISSVLVSSEIRLFYLFFVSHLHSFSHSELNVFTISRCCSSCVAHRRFDATNALTEDLRQWAMSQRSCRSGQLPKAMLFTVVSSTVHRSNWPVFTYGTTFCNACGLPWSERARALTALTSDDGALLPVFRWPGETGNTSDSGSFCSQGPPTDQTPF